MREAGRVSGLTLESRRPPATGPRPASSTSVRPGFSLDEELWFGLSDEVGKEEAKRSLAATVARELGVRAAPTTVAAIGALDLDTAPVDAIIKVFEADPALAARVLSVVNSAGYALTYRCRSIRHAVVMLGVRAVAALATASSFMDFLTTDSETAERLTAHAHDVAVLSAHLAFLSGESREQAYAIGLLHDLGRSMLLQSEEQRYQPLAHLGDESVLADREREEFGFDHAILGASVLRAWQIPDPIPTVVGHHHAPHRVYAKGGRDAALTCILRLADRLAPALRASATPDGDALAAVIAEPSQDILGLDARQVEAAWSALRAVVLEERQPGDAPLRSLTPSRRPDEEPATDEAAGPVFPDVVIQEAPSRLLCSACAQPTLGDECPACHRALCRDHLPHGSVCNACEAAVREARRKDPWLSRLQIGAVVASVGILAVLVSLLIVRLIGRTSSLLELGFFVLAAALVAFAVNAALRAFQVRMRVLGRQRPVEAAARPSLIVHASETPPDVKLREEDVTTAVERQVFRATAIGNLMERVRSLQPPALRDPSIPPSAGVPTVRGIFGDAPLASAPSLAPAADEGASPPPPASEVSSTDTPAPEARRPKRTRKPPAEGTKPRKRRNTLPVGAKVEPEIVAPAVSLAPEVITSAPPLDKPRQSRTRRPKVGFDMTDRSETAPPDSAVTRIGSTLPPSPDATVAPKKRSRARKAS